MSMKLTEKEARCPLFTYLPWIIVDQDGDFQGNAHTLRRAKVQVRDFIEQEPEVEFRIIPAESFLTEVYE